MLSTHRSIYKRSRISQVGLQLWLDATADQNFVTDNENRCTLALDRSQYARHFTQTNPDFAPVYLPNTLNSLPSLKFNGIDQFMSFSDETLSWLNNKSFTIFYVATKTPKTNTSMVIGGSSTGIRSNLAAGYISPTTYRFIMGQDDINAVVPTVAPGDPELLVLTYDVETNRREVRRNGLGVALGASDGSLFNMQDQSLGKYLTTYGEFDLGEIIIYDRVLQAYERTIVERDLASKWTITDALFVVNPDPTPEVLPSVLTKVVSMEMIEGLPPTDEQGTPGTPGNEITYDVTNSGTGAYVVDEQSNPTLSFIRGRRYLINVNATGHPFWIQTVAGAYSEENVYNTGVTNNGTQQGTIIVDVPLDAPQLYYACQFHEPMQGSISVVDPEVGDPGYVAAVPPSEDYAPASPGTEDTYFYRIDNQLNPALSLTRGITYIFNIDAEGYPLRFQTITGEYDPLFEYSNGVTNPGDDVGAITWNVSEETPSTLYYVAETKPEMSGVITIV